MKLNEHWTIIRHFFNVARGLQHIIRIIHLLTYKGLFGTEINSNIHQDLLFSFLALNVSPLFPLFFLDYISLMNLHTQLMFVKQNIPLDPKTSQFVLFN